MKTVDYLSEDIAKAHQSVGKLIQALQAECWRQYEEYCEKDDRQREKLSAGEIKPADFKRWREAELAQFNKFCKCVRRAAE